MKKCIILFILFCSILSFGTTHKLVTSGEYEGWYKLIDYEGDDKFDVYFKVQRKGTIISEHIQTMPNFKNVNFNEKITLEIEGKKITRTRKEWYATLDKATEGLDAEYARKVIGSRYPKLANEYYKDNYGFDDNTMFVSRYIDANFKLTDIPERKDDENKYCENPNLSVRDQQMCVELAEKEYIENSTKPVENDKKKKVNPKKKKSWLNSIGNAVGSFLDETANSTF